MTKCGVFFIIGINYELDRELSLNEDDYGIGLTGNCMLLINYALWPFRSKIFQENVNRYHNVQQEIQNRIQRNGLKIFK